MDQSAGANQGSNADAHVEAPIAIKANGVRLTATTKPMDAALREQVIEAFARLLVADYRGNLTATGDSPRGINRSLEST